MKPIVLALALAASVGSLADDVRVDLPKDYQQTFVEYLSLDRVQNPDQFIRLFANKTAMQGKNDQGDLPDGSVLVAEVYSVKKNADGSVQHTALNRRVKDKLLLLAVMEKQAGFGETSSSPIKTGDWDFAAYKPNGELAPKNLDECRACHAPLTDADFLFSIEHILPQ